jgi:hypothetical protein
MPQLLETKLIVETASGTRIRAPAVLNFTDAGRIEFLKSPFALKDEIKSMQGSKWHGYVEGDKRKIWTVKDCLRNRIQLQFLMGQNPFEWFDQEVRRHTYSRSLMLHQKDLSDAGLTYHFQIWAAEMGCVTGDAVVSVNRAGKGFELSLRELCYKFHGGKSSGESDHFSSGGGRAWDSTIDTYVQSFRGSRVGLTRIKDVLYKGVRRVLRVKTDTKELILTPDHEVCIGAYRYGTFKRADQLVAGDTVMVRVKLGHLLDTPAVQVPPELLKKTTVMGSGHWLDKDGYIRIGGLKGHPRWASHGVYEHLLVMETLLGRPVQYGEEVHHINRQRWDNRPENLVLCATHGEHAEYHDNYRNLRCGQYAFEPIVSIEDAGAVDVYDIKCVGPYHNFVANDFVVHNCGKTLSAIEVMERSDRPRWFWVGPKSGLLAVEREFKKWNLSHSLDIEMMTYEGLVKRMKSWEGQAPYGVVFDESSRAKNHTSQRAQAAQALADGIRTDWGMDGYVILMSGTPSPKTPLDWWSQCEIAYPGWLKEGQVSFFEKRLAFIVNKEGLSGIYPHRIGWKDSEEKCAVCGLTYDDGPHSEYESEDLHSFERSTNEVAYLYERLKGLVVIKNKKDCLDLPDKQYRRVYCEPTPTTLRVAKSLLQSAPSTIVGLTRLRELSDGFQYMEKVVGKTKCPACTDGTMDVWIDPDDEDKTFTMVDFLDPEYVATLQKVTWPCSTCSGDKEVNKIERYTREVPCPKEPALIDLLDENEEQGRLVIFAGFTGSVDRVVKICQKQGWDIVRMDQGNADVFNSKGERVTGVAPLDYWADLEKNVRVAFVAHPKSGGMALTLVESRMAVYWSNSYEAETRTQSEDRIHRIGTDMNLGATIVDLIHLPTDEKVLEILKQNRDLEKMTLGEISEGVDFTGAKDED